MLYYNMKMKLTPPQKKALAFITAHPGTSVEELAAELGTSASGAGLVLGRLVAKSAIGMEGGKATVAGSGDAAEDAAPTAPATPQSIGQFIVDLRHRLAIQKFESVNPAIDERAGQLAKAKLDTILVELMKEYGIG